MSNKFDPTKPVVTRCGYPAKILKTDLRGTPYPIAAVIELPLKETGVEPQDSVRSYTPEGNYYQGGPEHQLDLINVVATPGNAFTIQSGGNRHGKTVAGAVEFFDATKPVQTRSGEPARIISTDRRGNGLKTIVALRTVQGEELVTVYYASGHYYANQTSDYDLVNIPETVELWVNVYPTSHGRIDASPHSTREQADANATPRRIACVKISAKKGDGL